MPVVRFFKSASVFGRSGLKGLNRYFRFFFRGSAQGSGVMGSGLGLGLGLGDGDSSAKGPVRRTGLGLNPG
jgi:hypothetical protein